MMDDDPNKYSMLETFFCDRWQWVRRRSRQYWVRDRRPGHSWVKFGAEEMAYLGHAGVKFNDADYEVEDWRSR